MDTNLTALSQDYGNFLSKEMKLDLSSANIARIGDESYLRTQKDGVYRMVNLDVIRQRGDAYNKSHASPTIENVVNTPYIELMSPSEAQTERTTEQEVSPTQRNKPQLTLYQRVSRGVKTGVAVAAALFMLGIGGTLIGCAKAPTMPDSRNQQAAYNVTCAACHDVPAYKAQSGHIADWVLSLKNPKSGTGTQPTPDGLEGYVQHIIYLARNVDYSFNQLTEAKRENANGNPKMLRQWYGYHDPIDNGDGTITVIANGKAYDANTTFFSYPVKVDGKWERAVTNLKLNKEGDLEARIPCELDTLWKHGGSIFGELLNKNGVALTVPEYRGLENYTQTITGIHSDASVNERVKDHPTRQRPAVITEKVYVPPTSTAPPPSGDAVVVELIPAPEKTAPPVQAEPQAAVGTVEAGPTPHLYTNPHPLVDAPQAPFQRGQWSNKIDRNIENVVEGSQ